MGRQMGRALRLQRARGEARGDVVGGHARGAVEPHVGRAAQRIRLGPQVRAEQQRRALGHARGAGDVVRAVPALRIRPVLRELRAASSCPQAAL